MGQLIAVLLRTIAVGLFAAWMFFVVFPHPDRSIIAVLIIIVLVPLAYLAIGLLRDLQRKYPVAEYSAPGRRLTAMELKMEETKSWYHSRTILGGAVAAVAGLAQLAGYSITPADQLALVDTASQIGGIVAGAGSLVGGLVAIWGRIRASKTIAAKTA